MQVIWQFIRFKVFVCWILLVLCWLAGTVLAAETSFTETVDRIVAIVNDDVIRLKEFEAAFAPVEKQIRSQNLPAAKTRGLIEKQRKALLNQLIQRTLADQVIEREGISVSKAEVDGAIEQVKSMNGYTDEMLLRSLSMNGVDMKTYREEIRRQILQSKLVNRKVKSNVVITDEDIREYHEAHPKMGHSETKYHLKNIFMACGDSVDAADRKEIRQRMEKALNELNDGRSFEAVARKYSEGSNASDGGELGTFSLNDLQQKLREVIQNLDPGEISGIVETDQGFQIFYVSEIVKPTDKALESVYDEIRKQLYEQAVNEKFQEWIEGLRQDSHIKIIY